MPDPSQVTAVAAQAPVATWLTIYFQPSDSIQSLHSSSINTVSVCSETQTAGLFWWQALLLTGRADLMTKFNRKCLFWLVETVLLHTWHNGRPWEPVQLRTKQTENNAFSFIPVIISYCYFPISLIFKAGYSCLNCVFIDTAKCSLDQRPGASLSACVQTASETNGVPCLAMATWRRSWQRLCECSQEMSPSSVFSETVFKTVCMHIYFVLVQIHE